MAEIHQLSAGGLALGADGEIADLPRDLAHQLSGELLDVIALLRATESEIDKMDEEGGDDDKFTSADSRKDAFLRMAREKVGKVLEAMSPYV